MSDEQALRLQTLAVQTPGEAAPPNGLAAPLHVAATYVRDESNLYPSDHVYGRADNPTVRQTEALLAALETGDAALLFSTGMAASIAVMNAFDGPTTILAPAEMYDGLRRWLLGAHRFGHAVEFVDMTDLGAVGAALHRVSPALVWIETPSNPMWRVTDIAAVTRLAHAAGALVCVDSTVSTPCFTRPLELGADIVMHSATKYLNGHSDVIAGALITRGPADLWRRIATMRTEQGTTLGAFEAWLLARGLRTLDIRLRTQAATAARLARRLVAHPAVVQVLYPGLETHPGHAVAARQMQGGFGAMLSIRIAGGREAALDVVAGFRLWKRATSFGGVESLVEHRASMEGEGSTCPDDLLRLSVGIEDERDLHADLDRALGAVAALPLLRAAP